MNKTKQVSIALLAGACSLCLVGGIALHPHTETGHAAENYVAFVDVGANTDAAELDAALSLENKGFEATVAGTVAEKDNVERYSLFTTWATNATYTAADLPSANYQVAVAVIAEKNLTVTVNDTAVTVPEGASGRTLLTTTVSSATSVEIEVTGKLCGAMVAPEGSKVLFTADYNKGQIVRYGSLLEDELENATAYYSDGTTEELEIEYGDITANTGVNLNFTTVDVASTIVVSEDVTVPVTRHLTTMPDDLIYFINCGSYTYDGDDPGTADSFYSYNSLIFDYYGGNLINKDADGNYIPDQVSTSNTQWGRYTAGTWGAPGDSTFPYNTMVWTNTVSDLGYYLTGLDASKEYRIWFGTLSHWHGRTSDMTFNGQIVGSGEIVIGADKGITVVEGVKPTAQGLVDIHMTQRGSKNEPTINFIAVQTMETPVAAVPATPNGSLTAGMEDTSYTFSGAEAGAKVQIYNAAKPNQVLYEEAVDTSKIVDGNYTVDTGIVLSEVVAQFCVVQITDGGASKPLTVTVTDIQGYEAKVVTEGYSSDKVTISLKANADSGIASWEYRLGEYGERHTTVLPTRVHDLDITFDVAENGTYYIVVTSGRNVSFEQPLNVTTIDTSRPTVSITPSKDGWKKGDYNVTLTVRTVAPVTSYTLYKGGSVVTTAATAPTSLKFTEKGEYTVYVETATGYSATGTVIVSDEPTLGTVTKTLTNSGARYTFGNSEDFDIEEVTVHKVGSSVERMTVASGNSLVLDRRNGAGTYVVTVRSTTGAVEMFSLVVERSDLTNGGSGNGPLIAGIVVGASGLVLAAAAFVVTVVLLKRKNKE